MQEDSNGSFTQDLGKIVEILLRQWQLILSVTLVCAIAAGLMSYLTQKSYQAETLVATNRMASSVSFGSEIETLSEEQFPFIRVDPETRLQSYLLMLKNPLIAQQVLVEVGDQLDEEQRNITFLLRSVDGEVAGRSDTIKIIATYQDPAVAAAIANAWGKAYVEQVNTVYSNNVTDESLDSIQDQSVVAKQTYETVQTELEEFIATNQSDALSRQIVEQEEKINNLVAVRNAALLAILESQSQASVGVYGLRVQDLQSQLAGAYDNSRRIDRLLLDTGGMLIQVLNGGDEAANSNALALTLLKSQVFASNKGESDNLQIQTVPVSMTTEGMVSDLEGLMLALQSQQEQVAEEIQQLSAQMIDIQVISETDADAGEQALSALLAVEDLVGLDRALGVDFENTALENKIQVLEGNLRSLKAQQARESSTQQELERARELAWQTYNSLVTKSAEMEVAIQTLGTEVSLASPAAVPRTDTTSGTKNVMIAAVVGFLLGIFAAFSIEFWWSYKGIEPRPVLHIGY